MRQHIIRHRRPSTVAALTSIALIASACGAGSDPASIGQLADRSPADTRIEAEAGADAAGTEVANRVATDSARTAGTASDTPGTSDDETSDLDADAATSADTTTHHSPTESSSTTEPVGAPPNDADSSANTATEAVGAESPQSDSDDETPLEPGARPDGIIPLDIDLRSSDDSAEATSDFEYVEMQQPAQPAPSPAPFAAVDLTSGPSPTHTPSIDDLDFTAATGCAQHCIDDATITAVGGSSDDYRLDVSLESDADVEAYLSLAPIQRNADGHYIRPTSVPTASTHFAAEAWNTTFDLEPGTEYHLLVRANDEQGTSAVAGSFTTAPAFGPDELIAPMPCADGCLEWVSTDTHPGALVGEGGTELSVTVAVDTDATLEFAWTTDPFVQTDDGPTLLDPIVDVRAATPDSNHTLHLTDLTPNTAYSVMITATDPIGGVDRMVGTIATPSPIISAAIERVHISGDGDDGNLNRGEIRFRYGAVGNEEQTVQWSAVPEQKIASNTVVDLNRPGGVLRADGSGLYPTVVLYAGERDGEQIQVCFIGIDDDWRPADSVTFCGRERTTWSNTYVPQLTFAEIEALPACGELGVTSVLGDRCMWVHTPPNGSDAVSFDMVVSFELG